MAVVKTPCPACHAPVQFEDKFGNLGKRVAMLRCGACGAKFRLTHPLGNAQMETDFMLAADVLGDEDLI